ncbi:MAG: hypothetical protein PHC56_06970 [Herbinix sp.]|nr:hypothetical protein [Herbinix sp.]
MRCSIIHVIELILGALLLGLGLIYLTSQQKALTRLTDNITILVIEDNNVYQQYNMTNTNEVSDIEVYAAIMGYRDFPIMVDDNIVPLNGHDYELYFSYVRDGNYYNKEYLYDVNRHVSMIIYTYMGM